MKYNITIKERYFNNILHWVLPIWFFGSDKYNIWHCNEYVIQFMTSYCHTACCWVRWDLFLLWQLVANKWTELQWFFLSTTRMLIIFFIWNLNEVVKEGRRWKEKITLVCFLLLNIKHQTLEGTHFTKKKYLLIWNNVYLSKNISLNCSTDVLYYYFMFNKIVLYTWAFSVCKPRMMPK